MTPKNIIIGSALMAVALGAISIYSASAYWQDGDWKKGPNYSPERHETMEKVFENKDYDGWKKIMEETNRGRRVLDVVNKDNFSKFAEAHELMEQGKFAEARKIREELGLRNGSGRRGGGMAHTGFVDANGDGACDHQAQR